MLLLSSEVEYMQGETVIPGSSDTLSKVQTQFKVVFRVSITANLQRLSMTVKRQRTLTRDGQITDKKIHHLGRLALLFITKLG